MNLKFGLSGTENERGTKIDSQSSEGTIVIQVMEISYLKYLRKD